MKTRIYDIEWDTDEDEEVLQKLPDEVIVDNAELNSDFEDYLSDKYGFCMFGFKTEQLDSSKTYLLFYKNKCVNAGNLDDMCSSKKEWSNVYKESYLKIRSLELSGTIEEQVDQFFEATNLYYEYYWNDNSLIVDIDMGDWKHDHLHLDALIEAAFDVKDKNTFVFDDTGEDDCYPARHTYVLSKPFA